MLRGVVSERAALTELSVLRTKVRDAANIACGLRGRSWCAGPCSGSLARRAGGSGSLDVRAGG